MISATGMTDSEPARTDSSQVGHYALTRVAFDTLISVEIATSTLLETAVRLQQSLKGYESLSGFAYVRPPEADDDPETQSLIEERQREIPSRFRPLQRLADRWHVEEREFRAIIQTAKAVVDQTAFELDAPSIPPLARTSIAIKRALGNLSGCVPYPMTSGWAQGAAAHTVDNIRTQYREVQRWTEELRLLVQPEHPMAGPYKFASEAEGSRDGGRIGSDPQPAPDLEAASPKKGGKKPPRRSKQKQKGQGERRRALSRPGPGTDPTGALAESILESGQVTRAKSDHLTKQQRRILRFLRDNHATSEDDLLQGPFIASKEFGSPFKRIKDNLARLVRRELTGSNKGPDGGYWIKPTGLALLIALGERPIATTDVDGHNQLPAAPPHDDSDQSPNSNISE